MKPAGIAPTAWPLVVRMLIWRITLPVAKRFVATDRLIRMLVAPRRRTRGVAREDLAVRLAGRLWRSSEGPCLERSVALYRELGRLGADPTLVLGMTREDGALAGHAWVEVEGRALLESGDPAARWTSVVRYDAAGARHP